MLILNSLYDKESPPYELGAYGYHMLAYLKISDQIQRALFRPTVGLHLPTRGSTSMFNYRLTDDRNEGESSNFQVPGQEANALSV